MRWKNWAFLQVRQKGSHVILRKETESGAIGCVVPLHDDLATGTLRGILKQAQLDPDEFAKAL